MTSATDTREKLLEDLLDKISGWRSYDGNFMHIYSSVVYAYVKELLDRQAEIVKREYDETHMELPLDADGVPIHLGDLLFRDNGDMHYCHAIGKPSLDIMDEHLKWWRSECFHHTKPRTIVDVLADFAAEVERGRSDYETAKRYADEIRELIGGAE